MYQKTVGLRIKSGYLRASRLCSEGIDGHSDWQVGCRSEGKADRRTLAGICPNAGTQILANRGGAPVQLMSSVSANYAARQR